MRDRSSAVDCNRKDAAARDVGARSRGSRTAMICAGENVVAVTAPASARNHVVRDDSRRPHHSDSGWTPPSAGNTHGGSIGWLRHPAPATSSGSSASGTGGRGLIITPERAPEMPRRRRRGPPLRFVQPVFTPEPLNICRDYRTTATIEGRQQQLYGTACRQPDGSWQRAS